MQKQILVSGSNGFIGKNLTSYLRKKNNKFFTIGSKKSDYRFNFSSKNPKILKIKNIDIFIHLELRNESYFRVNEEKYFYQNYYSMKNAIKLVQKNKIKRIVYLSSIHVYDKKFHFIDEKSKIKLDNFYELSHYINEIMLMSNDTDYKYNILRVSNVYNNYNIDLKRKTLVTNSFLENAINKKKIIINGCGSEIRNFISMDYLIKSIFTNNRKIFNVVSKNNLSIKNFAILIKQSFKKFKNINIEIIIMKKNKINDKVKRYKTIYNKYDKYKIELFIKNNL